MDSVHVVGDGGAVLHTTDSGGSWTSQSSGTAARLTGGQFITNLTGYLTGEAGALLKTTDAGATWNATSSPATSALRALYFDPVGSTRWIPGEWVSGPQTVLTVRAQKQFRRAFRGLLDPAWSYWTARFLWSPLFQ